MKRTWILRVAAQDDSTETTTTAAVSASTFSCTGYVCDTTFIASHLEDCELTLTFSQIASFSESEGKYWGGFWVGSYCKDAVTNSNVKDLLIWTSAANFLAADFSGSQTHPNGAVLSRHFVSGQFRAPFDLRQWPFDTSVGPLILSGPASII
uniref:Uncharacterized protein n=1 Tax=Chromera velia CCMP2878 TaxID=1169474 RepID=A0A0K6SAA7_9ALVE|eukprot:Cvel_1503.t2-p1 / transcript=Cvel_1503.t2 / gene=Cvel_1503 / organism=Chromera_velia_CCMP2878 / gene_product=hypothetical protein / transcript_product=hypothetical protein / location=Cvel_scaffold52:150176-151097(-) / protein_length=151 / sequence_SO=supercontig / SO=protein_coding / is_pseudo=false